MPPVQKDKNNKFSWFLPFKRKDWIFGPLLSKKKHLYHLWNISFGKLMLTSFQNCHLPTCGFFKIIIFHSYIIKWLSILKTNEITSAIQIFWSKKWRKSDENWEIYSNLIKLCQNQVHSDANDETTELKKSSRDVVIYWS